MIELANADADHAGFAEVIKAETAEDVVDVVGRIDPVVDVIGVGLKVGEIGRVREKVDVVADGFHHHRIGVAQASFGASLERVDVIGAHQTALSNQRSSCGIALQHALTQPHRLGIAQAVRKPKDVFS